MFPAIFSIFLGIMFDLKMGKVINDRLAEKAKFLRYQPRPTRPEQEYSVLCLLAHQTSPQIFEKEPYKKTMV